MHFGILYQSIDFVISLIEVLYNAIQSDAGNALIHIPDIVLPFGNHVLVHAIDFDLASYIQSNGMLQALYVLFRTVTNGMLTFYFIDWCHKKLKTFLSNGEDNG